MAQSTSDNELRAILEAALASVERAYVVEREKITNQLERLDGAVVKPKRLARLVKKSRSKISAAGRKRISEAQKKRWSNARQPAVEDKRSA